MEARAVVLSTPRTLSVDSVGLTDPAAGDIVVAISHSGISTGTEKLLWTGEMPPFPGLGYPLIPGYEAVGTVMEAGRDSVRKPGDRVFVPGANCFEGARGLFGGAASCLVTTAERTVLVDPGHGAEAVLLALAATARHAIAGLNTKLPDLIVGHGTLGRLLARLTIAAGGKPPVVWETNADRRVGTHDYKVIDPADDEGAQYGCIYDASGDPDSLNTLIRHIKKGGEIVLAGFYAKPLSFAFPPAFMKEARIRIAAEWTPDDMLATRMLVESGALSLADLITHTCPAEEASDAYLTAFTDPACLKMILDWGKTA